MRSFTTRLRRCTTLAATCGALMVLSTGVAFARQAPVTAVLLDAAEPVFVLPSRVVYTLVSLNSGSTASVTTPSTNVSVIDGDLTIQAAGTVDMGLANVAGAGTVPAQRMTVPFVAMPY